MPHIHHILIADGHDASLLAQLLTPTPNLTIIGTATDGLDALTAIQTLQPEVIVLDIALTSLDGLTLASRLSPAQQRKILLHSAHYNQATIAQAMALGIPYFLPKPATQEALLAAIQAIAHENTGIALPNPT